MGDWEFRNCMHGIREGLDSHECCDCQAISIGLGYEQERGKTYLFSSQRQVDGLKKKKFEKVKGKGVKKITKYEADDGTIFDSQHAAEQHENKAALRKEIKRIVGKNFEEYPGGMSEVDVEDEIMKNRDYFTKAFQKFEQGRNPQFSPSYE